MPKKPPKLGKLSDLEAVKIFIRRVKTKLSGEYPMHPAEIEELLDNTYVETLEERIVDKEAN